MRTYIHKIQRYLFGKNILKEFKLDKKFIKYITHYLSNLSLTKILISKCSQGKIKQ